MSQPRLQHAIHRASLALNESAVMRLMAIAVPGGRIVVAGMFFRRAGILLLPMRTQSVARLAQPFGVQPVVVQRPRSQSTLRNWGAGDPTASIIKSSSPAGKEDSQEQLDFLKSETKLPFETASGREIRPPSLPCSA